MKPYNEDYVKAHYDFIGHKNQTEIRVIVDKEDKSKYQESQWVLTFYIKSYEELLEIVKKYSGERHIYIGINERRENGSKISDIDFINFFVIDVDNKTNFIETQQVALKIKEDAEAQGFKEPMLVISGNGCHIYFALEPIPNTEENRKKIKDVGYSIKNKYQNEYCVIDEAVFEPARVMRLAGTMNVKKSVNALCTIGNIVARQEDKLFTQKIIEFVSENKTNIPNNEISDELKQIFKEDFILTRLYNGDIQGFESRSEAEQSLVCRFIRAGMTKEQVFNYMASCKIGKWQEAHIQYRELTYKKALEIIIKEKTTFREKNLFKNLHYETKHLPYYDNVNKLTGLYGKHYASIKKARWYQLTGGVIQKQIRLGEKFTDTRINCIFPLPTEQGKNDLIYLFKDVVGQVLKNTSDLFKIEEPISYHPEQLIGKVIEIQVDNPKYLIGEVKKPKKIPQKVENRGYFDADFVEIDEANALIFNTDDQTKQAREYVSKALNPIGRNEVVKKSVDDLPNERVSYCPNCTFSLYFQPKKINEDLLQQGFLRRFLLPVGNIQPFLNFGNEDEFKRKTALPEFSRHNVKEELIKHLESVRVSLKDKDFIFTEEALNRINLYHTYLIAEGQVHSEKISNLTKLVKWTIQDYLIRMSCILAGSYKTNIVNENHVALAYMDLVELLQSTFDFIKEWVNGNFDYGVTWRGANYKEKTCLEFLYEKNCFSEDTSSVSILEFQNHIKEVFGVKDTRAREVFSAFKKNKWIDSKQIGQYDSKVWLGFIPETENLIAEGDKGVKGVALYESVYSSINNIISTMSPSLPLSPSIQRGETK